MTTSEEFELEAQRSRVLVGLAREAIESEFAGESGQPSGPGAQGAWLEQRAATFVTLEISGRLRGCIGSLEAKRSLRDDVLHNARSAAFEDPRFPPVSAEELSELEIEVSVLSSPESIPSRSEAELLDALRPGVDGLVLEFGRNRATFLPQVWTRLREPADFLAALKRKARLDGDFWSDEMRFSRYTVATYSESPRS